MVDLIEKKKMGDCHSAAELNFIVQGYTGGEIPDYQMAAWLMAVRFRGMDEQETVHLTLSMADSGSQLDLSGIPGVKVDKHSTGGVADTTTLIVAPLVAAAGVTVAKMSGRGLGFTGGTIDKLESIPGFRTALGVEEFKSQLQKVGLAIMGQTADIAPADGKIYALRDVTGTVDSLPLIASSVMSKKIAAGAEKILLDVKYGSGAFMKTVAEARELARVMVAIGAGAGRETVAIVSSMEEPLGTTIGNSLEVAESIEILRGAGDVRLREFCVLLAAKLVMMAKPGLGIKEAETEIRRLLHNGSGLAKFREFVEAQGGDGRVAEDTSFLGIAGKTRNISAVKSGYISAMHAAEMGRAAILLGAGRAKKGDPLDLTAGIKLHRRCGDYLQAGEIWATLFFNEQAKDEMAAAILVTALRQANRRAREEPLVAGAMDAAGWHG